MCGRYALYGPISRYSRWFMVDEAVECPPRFNIAPSLEVPVVRQSPEGKRRFVIARWGLVPYWVKDPAASNKPVNAKVETAASRPMFRDAWRERRVLVPADGFYEWQPVGGRKQPYFVRLKSHDPIGIGGLLETWRGPSGPLTTFAVLVTDANQLLKPIHDRMPVIIRPEDYAEWLNPKPADPERLAAMTTQYPAEQMEIHPVGMMVNRADQEGEALIEPIGQPIGLF